jgi:hypothetical protein
MDEGVARDVTRIREMRNTYRSLVGNHQGTGLLGRHTHRPEDDIKVNRREIKCKYVQLIEMTQWRTLVNMVMNFRFPQKRGTLSGK